MSTAYPPANYYTGPPEQVHRLCKELRAIGVEVRVLATNSNGPDVLDVPVNRWIEHEGVPVFYGRRLPGTREVSWYSWRELRRAAGEADLVHVTALYTWANIAAEAVARGRVPVVISPRGSLDPAALVYGALKKAIFHRLGGYRALERAAAFHVTSEMEASHVRAFVPGAATFVVPNGVVLPTEEDLRRWRGEGVATPTVLYLGRLHPKKNLLALVDAWAPVAARHTEARLVLAGPDERGHRAEIERRIASLGLGASVELAGRVGGDVKHGRLASAACLVLPSHTENFGNVVVEALAHGVPVIASTGTPWDGLETRGCGVWVEPTVEGLGGAMLGLLEETRESRMAMGARGRSWMAAEFAWPVLARRMAEAYASILEGRIP